MDRPLAEVGTNHAGQPPHQRLASGSLAARNARPCQEGELIVTVELPRAQMPWPGDQHPVGDLGPDGASPRPWNSPTGSASATSSSPTSSRAARWTRRWPAPSCTRWTTATTLRSSGWVNARAGPGELGRQLSRPPPGAGTSPRVEFPITAADSIVTIPRCSLTHEHPFTGACLRQLPPWAGSYSSGRTPCAIVVSRKHGRDRPRHPGKRLADALDTLLMFRNLRESQHKLEASRAELAASRARIVTAADHTRRRIERDLHDGVQQRLVSLALGQRRAPPLAQADSRPRSRPWPSGQPFPSGLR